MIPSPEQPQRKRLLLVEDDLAIANGIALNLRLEGFEAEVVTEGQDALPAIARLRPDLVLLDITLPRRNGLEILAELRQQEDLGRTPVIVVSARQNEFDKVTALRLGADDYVTKPFGVAELLARIEAVLRRTTPAEAPAGAGDAPAASAPAPGERFRFGSIELDTATREVRRAGELVPLTHLEFELARFFAAHPDRVFTRDTLLERIWGIRHGGSARTVDNFVAQLRAKLEDDPSRPRHYRTVRGSGYRFVAD
jgi:DNA-binding response OmpR family regulator